MNKSITISVGQILIAAIAILLVSLVAVYQQYSSVVYQLKPLDFKQGFKDCLVDTSKLAEIDISQISNYTAVWNLCNKQIYQTLNNDDFLIRREKFRLQQFDERINLWLVVTITLSGVALAASQLRMSYKIALSGKESWPSEINFAIEKDKITFRSSYVGLAILAMSLAFFVVYVGWIYSQREAVRSSIVGDVELSVRGKPQNGLGPPPANGLGPPPNADRAAPREATPSPVPARP